MRCEAIEKKSAKVRDITPTCASVSQIRSRALKSWKKICSSSENLEHN